MVKTNANLFDFNPAHTLNGELVMPQTIATDGDGPISELVRAVKGEIDPIKKSLLVFQLQTVRFTLGCEATLPALPADILESVAKPSRKEAPTTPTEAPRAVTPVTPSNAPASGEQAVGSILEILDNQAQQSPYHFNFIRSIQPPSTQHEPTADRLRLVFKNEHYFVSEPNFLAISNALGEGHPLIVEGPPGTGKSSLATMVTKSLGLDPEDPNHLIKVFCTPDIKKESFLYDWNDSKRLIDMQLLQAAAANLGFGPATLERAYMNLIQEAYTARYLIIHALLRAVLLPYRCVVLIDEVDKTFPEFDTLLLDILEQNSYIIPELGRIGQPHLPKKQRPIIIITSNAQRDLSGPVRRRSNYIYYNYLNEATEAQLLQAKLGLSLEEAGAAAQFFRTMREHKELRLAHVPSTAEVLSTVHALKNQKAAINESNLLKFHSFWLKSADDIKSFYSAYGDKLKTLFGSGSV